MFDEADRVEEGEYRRVPLTPAEEEYLRRLERARWMKFRQWLWATLAALVAWVAISALLNWSPVLLKTIFEDSFLEVNLSAFLAGSLVALGVLFFVRSRQGRM